jgi:hypothetical protein
MPSAYDIFVDDLAEALGKDKAQEAVDEGAPIGDADPVADIEAQAQAIGDAIKKWLQDLAGSDAYVKKPGGS